MKLPAYTYRCSFYLCCFVLLAACHSADTQDNIPETKAVFQTKKVNAIDDNTFKPADFVKNVHYVMLEVAPQSLFAEINKMQIRNNKIYILDLAGLHYLYIFDLSGKFITRLGKRGDGPGEYSRLGDFDVDSSGNVYLYDRQRMHMLKYDANWNFIASEKTPFRAEAFHKLGNNKFIFALEMETELNGAVTKNRIIVTDSSYHVLVKYFHFRDEDLNIKNNIGLFTESPEGILYNKPVNDTLYLFDKNGFITQAYYFDFGQKTVPVELRNDYSKLLEERKKGLYNYFYIMPFFVKGNITGNIFQGSNKAYFLYDVKKDVFYTKSMVAKDLSHNNINLPVAAIGDSTIVSWIDYDFLSADIDKKMLDTNLINHVEKRNQGTLLALYTLK